MYERETGRNLALKNHDSKNKNTYNFLLEPESMRMRFLAVPFMLHLFYLPHSSYMEPVLQIPLS